jgi:hypothetical protein
MWLCIFYPEGDFTIAPVSGYLVLDVSSTAFFTASSKLISEVAITSITFTIGMLNIFWD